VERQVAYQYWIFSVAGLVQSVVDHRRPDRTLVSGLISFPDS